MTLMMWRHRHHTPAPVDTRRALLDQVRALQDEVRHLKAAARTDSLTGLLSRDGLEEEYERSEPRVVLLLDLDQFKEINDTCGHDAGDEVLRIVGARLAGLPGTRVARLGGDELVIMLDGDGEAQQLADCIAAEITDRIGRPIYLPTGRSVHVGASVGVRLCTPGLTREDALRGADQAMYAAKGCPGGYVTWTPELGDTQGRGRCDD